MDTFYSSPEKPDEMWPMLYRQIIQYNADSLAKVVQNYQKIHLDDVTSTSSFYFKLPN